VLERSIRLPYDPVLRADFRLVRKTGTSAGGLPEIETDRAVLEDGQNSHADRFWAIGLARDAAGVVVGKRPQNFAGTGLHMKW
jgi:phage FluMu gp28-like protein